MINTNIQFQIFILIYEIFWKENKGKGKNQKIPNAEYIDIPCKKEGKKYGNCQKKYYKYKRDREFQV